MNYKMVVYLLGRILLIMALLMCLPLAVAILYREDTCMGFFAAVLAQLTLGLGFSLRKPKNTEIYAKEGFMIVAICWLLTSVFGALPFFVSGEIPSFADAFFETVSGFTTTGASILGEPEALSYSALFWRSFTHWIGGMGVLVFVLALMPKSHATQSMYIARAEMPGPQVGKLVSRLRSTAQILYGIYIALTALEVVCLMLAGMPFFDSLLNSFSTAGTGGFCLKNASIAAYDSVAIDMIIGVFMILFGINFSLFYLVLTGNVLQALKSEELRWYLGIIAVASVLIDINIMPQYTGFWQALRYSAFQVSSLITTTGFITADYSKWPVFSQTILILLMFVGACAGSTGGGIKVSRILILIKSSICELRHQLRPRSVTTITLEGKLIDSEVISSVMSYMALYCFIFIVSQLLLSLDAFSYVTNFTAVTTCINNVGPGLGSIGPVDNFSIFTPFSKIVLSFDMLAGRLELLPIAMLFMPSTWKRR